MDQTATDETVLDQSVPARPAQDEPEIADELLIEEISIDGMCGVY
ncbi:MAG: mycofactocin precursor MftA [Acidimicrobiia bacterium]